MSNLKGKKKSQLREVNFELSTHICNMLKTIVLTTLHRFAIENITTYPRLCQSIGISKILVKSVLSPS
jgi:hypothetical protein